MTTAPAPAARPTAIPSAVGPACLPLARLGMLQSVGARDVAALERFVLRVPWPAGAPMPPALRRDDHLFVVREGRVALLGTAPGGHRIMVALVERGVVYSSLGGVGVPDAIALEDAVVSPVPAATLRALVRRWPEVGLDLAVALTDRLAMLREVVAAVGQMHVEDRLWARVVALAERVGIATAAGAELRLALTHAQWALLVGGSRESVTLAFGRFRRAGMLTVNGRVIVVPWERLEAA